jgi:hypothetical protein
MCKEQSAMTSEEIAQDILAAFRRGEMPPLEALKRLIAAGVDPDAARQAVGINLTGDDTAESEHRF